jgi:hypothetical protein
MSMMLYGNPRWGRSSYQPKTERTAWDDYIDRKFGAKDAAELREFQARLYTGGRSVRMVLDVERAMLSLPSGGNRSLLDQILFESKMEKRHSARIRQSLRAAAPAATAEQTWAGYPLKVRRLTRQEREARKRFVERFYPNSSAFDVWYWLDGFHQVHTKATSWQKLTYGPRCLPVKEMKYGRTVW